MVYVLNVNKKPLMPTNSAKARILLKSKKAIVVSRKPFTIQLTYAVADFVQPVTLGVDSGYLNIGFSAVTEKKELISGEVKLLQNMKLRIQERAMYRSKRRSRLCYRKPRFDNRRRNDGWLAPSIQHKLDSHLRFIEKLKKLLPISKIIVEVANFDVQKIKNPDISGVEYQNGEQSGFWNLREYVLHRDNHTCQNPDCKHKSSILQVHHIVFVENGGSNIPANLITLCSHCHTSANHKKGKFLYDWQTKKPKLRSFKDATFMSMVRWKLVSSLSCLHTYGFETKSKRISQGLEKSHYNDAFCIADGNNQIRIQPLYFTQVRRNNRSLEKFYDAKVIDIRTGERVSGQELCCGRRTRNKEQNHENLRQYRGETVSKGRRSIRTKRYFYQPNDLVKCENRIFTVKGTHNLGTRVILKETGKSVKLKNLVPFQFQTGFCIS